MNRAFSSSEQEAIRTTKVINEDNYYQKQMKKKNMDLQTAMV